MICLQPEPESPESAVGQLVALRMEKEDAPWIARVTAADQRRDYINVIWRLQWIMEGGQNNCERRSRVSVEWKDRVAKASIILYGFEFTNASRLKQNTIKELKVIVSTLNSSSNV